jgi:hypothetical protein
MFPRFPTFLELQALLLDFFGRRVGLVGLSRFRFLFRTQLGGQLGQFVGEFGAQVSRVLHQLVHG